MKTYIIAEAGINHNRDVNKAIQLCDIAKHAGADAVKFQTFKTDNVMTRNTAKAGYQGNNTNNRSESQYEMVKKLELPFKSFLLIKKHCDKIGIEFLSTPDDEESLEYLINIGVNLIKIGSGEVNNIPFLRQIGRKKVPVILSTGMSTLKEVKIAYNELKDSGTRKISILHCTTDYPCHYEDVNLKAMLTLKRYFNCPIGYSDHTLGLEIPVAAVSLGADIIEKHFTIDRKLSGPDHLASLEPLELKKMVQMIRNIEKSFGNGAKKPTESEIEIMPFVRRSIVASRKIYKGEAYSKENLTTKRPGTGISSASWDKLIGHKAQKDYIKDELIDKDVEI